MSLAKKTTIGIIWHFAEMMSKRGISIAITLLLARFLTPDDYGLIAMMAVFTTIANELMESGLRQAVIRKDKPEQKDLNTAFYTNVALGALAYLILFASAPLIADFYNETRLVLLIRVIGISIIINSLQVVQSAILNRELRFKAQLKVTVPATIVSGTTAVIMAYTGFGVWALVSQMLISAALITIFLWGLNIWRPTLEVSRESFKELYSFGSKLFLSNLLDIIFLNIYIIVIAKIFAATVAGHYYFAKKITEITMSQLVKTVQVVTFPALATLQNDPVALKSGYRKVIQVTTFLLFPGLLVLAALAEPLFTVLLNYKWLPAVPYLQLMCIAGLTYPLHLINLNVLQIKGRTDLQLYIEIVKKIFTAIILFATYKYGVIGILIGQIVVTFVSYLPNSYFSGKLINYPAREQIVDFLPALILAGVISSIIYSAVVVSTLPAWGKILLYGPIAGIAYVAMSYVLKIEAINMLEHILKGIIQKRD